MKNANNDHLISCYSCAHSQGGIDRHTHEPQLYCTLTMQLAEDKCSNFVYEPGTKEEE